jgi:adenosine deaminase
VKTGAVASLPIHPLRKLVDAGVAITLNTDDPGIFETTLEQEFALASAVLGLTDLELDTIMTNADRYKFVAR